MPTAQIRVTLVHVAAGVLMAAGGSAAVVYAGGHLAADVLLILIALGVLVAIVPSLHFQHGVSQPMDRLQKMISQTQNDGDLARRLDGPPGSLLTPVTAAYNGLMASLQGIITRMVLSSAQVAQAAERLIVAARETSDGSERQIAVAREAAVGVADVVAGVHQASDRAEQTARIAQAAHGDSARGTAIVLDASAEIGRIAQSVEQSAQVVAALGERSNEISGIVNVIHAIADQTNLLALNAAIEAARAGEQGRGFAVVADEVRKLAERTTAATGEISTVIAAIQAETANAIAAIKTGSVQATNGAELARKAAEALDSINTGAQETLDNISAIAATMGEQSRKARAIAANVDDIIGLAEQNARNAHKTLDESTQLTCLAANLQEAGKIFKPGMAGAAAMAPHQRMPPLLPTRLAPS